MRREDKSWKARKRKNWTRKKGKKWMVGRGKCWIVRIKRKLEMEGRENSCSEEKGRDEDKRR